MNPIQSQISLNIFLNSVVTGLSCSNSCEFALCMCAVLAYISIHLLPKWSTLLQKNWVIICVIISWMLCILNYYMTIQIPLYFLGHYFFFFWEDLYSKSSVIACFIITHTSSMLYLLLINSKRHTLKTCQLSLFSYSIICSTISLKPIPIFIIES